MEVLVSVLSDDSILCQVNMRPAGTLSIFLSFHRVGNADNSDVNFLQLLKPLEQRGQPCKQIPLIKYTLATPQPKVQLA